MPDMLKCGRLKIVMACAVVVVCIIAGWVVFPKLMEALGVSPTFTCHCIGGLIGLFGGILFLWKYVF